MMKRQADPEDRLREAIKVFDEDDKGYISVAEVKAIIEVFGRDSLWFSVGPYSQGHTNYSGGPGRVQQQH
jgi:hypothetical protein